MKQEIFKEEVPNDKILRWRLVKAGSDISLHLVDKYGNTLHGGRVLQLRSDGTLIRTEDVSNDYGLQLNEAGQIKETTLL